MGKTFRRQKSWDDYDNDYSVKNTKKKKKFDKRTRADKTKNLEELANKSDWDFRYDDY